ncbi:hypothetical protein BH09VER1_BH09VER1_28510 [soil metagenome]
MKPRSDSKLKLLPADRQEQIVEWINTPKSETCPGGLRHALEQLGLDGFKTSIRALSEFWSWWRLQERFSSASERAQQIEELILKKNPDMSPERVREIGQVLFTLEAVDTQDREGYVAMENLSLARQTAETRAELEKQKLALAGRRVSVMEQKLKSLQGTLEDGALSDEQRVQRMKQVFGLA